MSDIRSIIFISILLTMVAGCNTTQEFAQAEESRIAARDNNLAAIKADRERRRIKNAQQYAGYTDTQYMQAGKNAVLEQTKTAIFKDVEVVRINGNRKLCGWVKERAFLGWYTDYSAFIWIDGDLHMGRSSDSMGAALDYLNAMDGCQRTKRIENDRHWRS